MISVSSILLCSFLNFHKEHVCQIKDKASASFTGARLLWNPSISSKAILSVSKKLDTVGA